MSLSLDPLRPSLEPLFRHPPLVQLLIELGLVALQHVSQGHASSNAAPFTSGVSVMRKPSRTAPTTSATRLLFPLGHVVATPPALAVLESLGIQPVTLLQRHVRGDWGDLEPEDIQANVDALQTGARLFSSYVLSDNLKVWVITEADRSVTTLLLPEDY